jgi:acetyltransferase-like isoleucine patch superfamily enzyme
MSELRKWWVFLRHPHAEIKFGRGVYLGPRFSLHIPDGGSFIVGDEVEFRRDFRAEITGGGRVVIGPDCHFTYSVLIQCSTMLEVGAHCTFAQGVIIVDGQHRFRDISRPMSEQGFDLHPVRIGPHAFVGSKATIMADLGERAVIGANSVVTRPMPHHTVSVGAPARPIDYFGPPGAEPPDLSSAALDAPS